MFGEAAKYVLEYDTKEKVDDFVTMYNVCDESVWPMLSPSLVKPMRECI